MTPGRAPLDVRSLDVDGRDPGVHPDDDRPGVVVVDAVERRRMPIRTAAPVRPQSADPATFPIPIDTAVTLDTESLSVPYGVTTIVRAPDGSPVCNVDAPDAVSLPAGDYLVELGGPVKTYLRVHAAVDVTVSPDRTSFEFDREAGVAVGLRSYHSRPAATVTTTTEPADLAAAVSTFGSALKTTSPERSYPTLRGHPPALDLGDGLAVPDGLAPPDTDVHIEVPGTFRAVSVVAPLAYYLGAEVVPGDDARLVADGFEHRLDDLETGVERVLKQTFLLDCVARTEGWYPVGLAERHAVESRVDLDFAALYDAPLADRLAAYLSVPHERVADQVPPWPLAAHVTDDAANATVLPYLADDLAAVRVADAAEVASPESLGVDVSGFVRSTGGGHLPRPCVEPPRTDALAHAWVGDGTPLAGEKLLDAGFDHRFERDPRAGDLSIAVVCNDREMAAEYDDHLYGTRDDLPFDVAVHRDCTVADLREVLAGDASFLHYVGHVEPAGLVCADGCLDCTTLDAVGVETFLLNGCRSFAQGVALVEAGAIGGVVTVRDVENEHATGLGRSVARLLDAGFTLRSALAVAADGGRGDYVVVGDGGAAVAQPEGAANALRLEPTDDGRARVTYYTYPTPDVGFGSVFHPYADGFASSVLVGARPETTLSIDALRELLAMEELPVFVDGDLAWTSEIDAAAVVQGPG